MFMPDKQIDVSETQLRVAFDGDAVLFSDESERIFKAHGLDKFFEHEKENENRLLDHVINLTCLQMIFICMSSYLYVYTLWPYTITAKIAEMNILDKK